MHTLQNHAARKTSGMHAIERKSLPSNGHGDLTEVGLPAAIYLSLAIFLEVYII